MVTSVHLLSGAVVAVVLKDPLLVAPVAFGLHYVLDGISHYAPFPVIGFKEKGIKGTSINDLVLKSIEPLLGIIIVAMFIALSPNSLRFPIFIGALFGWLPDLLVFLEWKFNIHRPYPIKKIEDKYHKHVDGAKGIVPQIVLAVSCVVFLSVWIVRMRK